MIAHELKCGWRRRDTWLFVSDHWQVWLRRVRLCRVERARQWRRFCPSQRSVTTSKVGATLRRNEGYVHRAYYRVQPALRLSVAPTLLVAFHKLVLCDIINKTFCLVQCRRCITISLLNVRRSVIVVKNVVSCFWANKLIDWLIDWLIEIVFCHFCHSKVHVGLTCILCHFSYKLVRWLVRRTSL